MENEKTGLFIRQLRKEKGLTQKDLANRLHVTDKAVSKWERGLCAPDIALLRPLAEALGTTVTELIDGAPGPARDEGPEAHTQSALAYAAAALKDRLRAVRRRTLAAAAAVLLLTAAAVLCILWRNGYFYITDKFTSPDGTAVVTVYRKDLSGRGLLFEDAVYLAVRDSAGRRLYVTYGDCALEGLRWSPDSRKYVLSLRYPDGSRLALANLETNTESNLTAWLTDAAADLPDGPGTASDIRFQFLQWSADGTALLIRYAFTGTGGAERTGYFWFDPGTGALCAPFELPEAPGDTES